MNRNLVFFSFCVFHVCYRSKAYFKNLSWTVPDKVMFVVLYCMDDTGQDLVGQSHGDGPPVSHRYVDGLRRGEGFLV